MGLESLFRNTQIITSKTRSFVRPGDPFQEATSSRGLNISKSKLGWLESELFRFLFFFMFFSCFCFFVGNRYHQLSEF
jgi:hypothetical protein